MVDMAASLLVIGVRQAVEVAVYSGIVEYIY